MGKPAAALVLLVATATLSPRALAATEIRMDTSAAPDLQLWADRAKRLCEIWFPVITDLLPTPSPPRVVKLVLEPSLNVPAYAMPSQAEIHISAAFVRSQQAQGNDDYGMVIHELTHTVQTYPRSSGWLTEGIADYIRYERFEPTVPRKSFDLDKVRYDEGYWASSAFLAWMESGYDRALVRKLHRALIEGNFKEAAFFQQATGRDLTSLWRDFVSTRKRQLAIPRPAPRPAGQPVAAAGGSPVPPLAAALAAASAAGRPLVVNLGADWCDLCREIDATLAGTAGTEASAGVHIVRYDIEEQSGRALAGSLKVKGVPALIALDAQGGEVDRYPQLSAARPRPDPVAWLKDVPLMTGSSLDDCVAGADKNQGNLSWQLLAARRLLKAGRSADARRFLVRASSAGDPARAAEASFAIADLDAASGDRQALRESTERLVEKHPTTPEGLRAFRSLATASDPPRALLALAVNRRLETPEPNPEELTDLLLHAVRAGAGEAAAKAASRLEPFALDDPRRFWFLAEAAHLQGARGRALGLAERARAFASSTVRSLIDQDIARYRRGDRRPSRLVASLGPAAASGGNRWPPSWSAAFARLRAGALKRPDLGVGRVGHWTLDDVSSSQAADASGLGHTATLAGFGASDRQAGRKGAALAFDPARKTVMTVNHSESLGPREELTVAAWIRAIDWKGNRRILQKGLNDNQYRLTAEDGKLLFDVVTESREPGGGRLVASAPLPPVGEWVHLAGTYDGVRLRLLVNGAEVASAPAAAGRIAATRDPLVIGCKRSPETIATNCFNGLIDEVVVYDRALTDEELRRLARPGPPRPSS